MTLRLGIPTTIPLAIVSIDVTKIPQGILHFKTVGPNLRELIVRHSPGDGLNVMELKSVKRKKDEEGKCSGGSSSRDEPKKRISHVVVDELILSIGTITFIESLAGVQKEKRINVNIKGETFYDLSGPDDIANIAVTLAMKRLGYGFIADQLDRFLGALVVPSLRISLL